MKTRESGMPDEDRWKSYFDPDFILNELGLDGICQMVVDLGCGYGTFSIPAARRISGTLYAIDIEAQMISLTRPLIQLPSYHYGMVGQKGEQ